MCESWKSKTLLDNAIDEDESLKPLNHITIAKFDSISEDSIQLFEFIGKYVS